MVKRMEAINRQPKRTGLKFLFLRILIYLCVTAGFLYQTSIVCDEHFKYKTVTTVSVVDALPSTNPPQTAVCVSNQIATFSNLSIIFRYYIDKDSKITRSGVMDPQDDFYVKASPFGSSKPSDQLVDLKRMYRYNYCFGFKTRERLELSPDDLLRRPRSMIYLVTMDTDFFIQSHIITGMAPLYIYMTGFDGDFDGLLRTPVEISANRSLYGIDIQMTYSTLVTRLSPPPYDTKCRDYSKRGHALTSKHNCMSQCLNIWTEKEGFIIGDHLIDRGIYENSSSIVIPWFIKTSWITEDYLKKWSKRNGHSSKKNKFWIDQLTNFLPAFRERWKFCNDSCGQADCVAETVVPHLISSFSIGDHYKKGPLKTFFLRVYPSIEPVVIVTSWPKDAFIDFVVYIFSCLSFWFGFYPLALVNYVRNRRETKRPVVVNCRSRIT